MGQNGKLQKQTIFDFKRLEEQLVQSEECDCIIHIESQDESLHKVSSFLQVRHVTCVFAVTQFDMSCPCVEPNLQFQVFDQWFEDLDPVFP